MDKHKTHFDILIAGSGFSGTLTALALHQSGFKVGVIERGTHPRFAIGESSTPIADMILRSISEKYDLRWLHNFSRYGSWQRSHPEIVCGIKRGFSYYKHYPGKSFSTNTCHDNELLVAASSSDERSDTNWLRADFDAYLVEKIKAYQIAYWEKSEITGAERINDRWAIQFNHAGEVFSLSCSFFIDATGGGKLAAQLFSVPSVSGDFHTHSFALFSHFENIPRWVSVLESRGISTKDYPYDPDFSALHHLLDEGWAWALRFNNERTSWGFVLDGRVPYLLQMNTEDLWQMLEQKYPDMKLILKDASLSEIPGRVISSGRLQRRLESAYGDGWVAMPHTIGFVDPLFSTGIAYSLAGMERVVEALCAHRDFGGSLAEQLRDYEQAVFAEIRLIDYLVAGAYKAMPYFRLFNAWSMLYFTFTILYERRRMKNLPVNYFLEADKPEVQKMVHTSYEELSRLTGKGFVTEQEEENFTDRIRQIIQPYNTAGLLNPGSKNMYFHTAAALD